MYESLLNKQNTLAVIGLGYVGLPLALAFAQKFRVIGFDINTARVEMMQQGEDPSKQLDRRQFEGKDIVFTSNNNDLKKAHFYVVAVPTAVDINKIPDLNPLINASLMIGEFLKKGDIVVYESTTYPGCTEEDCVPLLEKASGLKLGKDFQIGYSPERINPGDREKKLEDILKIVSGSDEKTLDTIANIYGAIIHAGIYRASSIKVAEAAKVIENTQRDLNISLMNELSILFDKLGIDTQEVLDAAATKWNFIRLSPGLVGGHCIAVDPYYLLQKARQVGYDPEVILSGRRVNDQMPAYIAKKMVQALLQQGKKLQNSKVLVMGITFKENISDIRNSKVADLVHELKSFYINIDLFDPYADKKEVEEAYNIQMVDQIQNEYDAILLAVNHNVFRSMSVEGFKAICNKKPIFFDLKAAFPRNLFEPDFHYWRL